jgi:hypothetical protein
LKLQNSPDQGLWQLGNLEFIPQFSNAENRLWIPHQVALEFQENRPEVIDDQENKSKKLI